ncbi:hypothetical protein EYC80_005300 [Monilinia laxa]|uniref:SH3 domain-containing protein n=1 Tax=Monilinia laxa TaxID=61186 RepID=A0A5N6KL75_MONLA|nr:hypothetical protein EYC80_005300 [Monilinia laxa]
MGQIHNLVTREVEKPLTAALNASIFVPFTGIPAVLPTDHESQLKLLKSHHHKVRENIVTSFVLEKKRLLSKCKDDLAKYESLVKGDSNENGLRSDFQLLVAAKEDARQKKEADELEKAKWLRGPRWLLLLQMEDAKRGVWDAPEGETNEQMMRREARLKREMGKREARLLKELKGHTSEEYAWKPKDFYDFESKGFLPDSEAKGDRNCEGDVVMRGLDSANTSPTQDWNSANPVTPYEIQQKFNIDVHKLLEVGIKKIKEYDQHAEEVVAECKKGFAKGVVGNIETAGATGLSKRKLSSMAGPAEPSGGILKRPASIQDQSGNRGTTLKKSVSIQTPAESGTSALEKSVSAKSPLGSEKHTPIQSPLSENGGSVLKATASIQSQSGSSSSTSKKSLPIHIPMLNQSVSPTTSPFANAALSARSPLDLTGSVLKKANLDGPLAPASPSPLSTDTPSFTQNSPFPMNVSTGPANSSPNTHFSSYSSVLQSPSTPSALSGPREERKDDPFGCVGKTFISTTTWSRGPRHYFNLEILSGDAIKITNHIYRDEYEGLNMDSQRVGRLDIKFYLNDLEYVDKPITAGTKRHNNSSDTYSPQYIGTKDDDRSDPKGNPAVNIGTTFTSSRYYFPKSENEFYNLPIRPGDRVKVIDYHSGNAYIGLNITTQRTGRLKMLNYLKDIEAVDNTNKTAMSVGPQSHPDDCHSGLLKIGEVFTATTTWGPKAPFDTNNLSIEIGDSIEIVNHISGNTYEGVNLRSKKLGYFIRECFRRDLERSNIDSIGKVITGTSTQCSKNTSHPSNKKHEVGSRDELENNTRKDPDVYIGKTFVATHTYISRNRNAINLDIEAGDAIEIINRNSDNLYEGYNVRTGKAGQFNISYFYHDIDIFNRIGKVSTPTSMQHNSDIEVPSRYSPGAEPYRIDLDPISRNSTSSNGSVDPKLGRRKFSIKGAFSLASLAVESEHVHETRSQPSEDNSDDKLHRDELERRIRMYTQHHGYPPKSISDYYQPNNPVFNPIWLKKP